MGPIDVGASFVAVDLTLLDDLVAGAEKQDEAEDSLPEPVYPDCLQESKGPGGQETRQRGARSRSQEIAQGGREGQQGVPP